MKGMETTHGKSGYSTPGFVLDSTVVFIHEVDDIGKCLFVFSVHRVRQAEGRFVKTFARFARCSFLGYVSVRHNDNHRFGLAFSNQVVYDLCCASER